MSYTIRTAEEFKIPITSQSRAWDLGAENVLARMAFTASLELTEAINLNELRDTKGKEYNAKILFGDYRATYEAMLCLREGITPAHPDFKRFVKAHVDRGLAFILEYANLDLAQLFELLAPSKSSMHG
jgi:DNA sulfur modification protein DndE